MAGATHPSRLPTSTLDDGTLRVHASHVGDGYYEVRCECDVCGAGANKTLTAQKARVKGIESAWFHEHWHNP
jgi:hypothetical protein